MASKARLRRLAWGYAATAAVVGAVAYAGWTYAPRALAWATERSIEFAHPEAFWLLLAAIPLWFFRLHSLTELSLAQQLVGALNRTAVIGLVALALAGPQRVEFDKGLVATAIVVDVSDSITDAALARANGLVADLWNARGDAAVEVIGVSERAERLPPPPTSEEGPPAPPRLVRPETGSAHTDLQAGIELALASLPDDAVRRIAVLTDGQQTRGAVLAGAALAKQLGVEVHTYFLGDGAPPPELLVRGIRVPPGLKPRIPFAVDALIEASAALDAVCTLTLDGEERGQAEVRFEAAGQESVAFDELEVAEGGEKKIVVTCKTTDASKDRFEENNRFETTAIVPKKPKVLYVDGKSSQTNALASALRTEFDVTVRGPGGLPASKAGLSVYDAVIASDLPRRSGGRTNFEASTMRAMRDYVKEGGVFVMAGGPNSFGPGGYEGTYLEKSVLPVSIEGEQKLESASVALMLVIDKSGSMSGLKIELAKEAAKATAGALKPNDLIGVIAFDGTPETIVPLAKASNRLYIRNNLSRLSSGGGTNIRPALDSAFRAIDRAKAQTKHVILLTDGQSDRSGILALAQRMLKRGITVSTVAVGDSADGSLLGQIAAAAGGRPYQTRDPSQIKRIFLQETEQIAKPAFVEERFRPRVAPRWSRLQLFRGLRSPPPLLGYVVTKRKKSAETLMTSPRGEPILARQRIGLGWSYAWTSDVKSRWARPWTSSGTFARFWRQLLRSSMPVDQEELFPVRARIERERLVIEADAIDQDDQFVNGLDVRATVKTPTGDEVELILAQRASGRYEAELPTKTYGAFDLRAEFIDPETAEPIATGRAVATYPYPDELALGSRGNEALVRALADAGTGRYEPEGSALFELTTEPTRRTAPIGEDLLLWALGLFVFDVFLRRVRLLP